MIMKPLMFTFISKNHKIIYSIVRSFFVNMMHSFFGSKISTNVFFHYKPMFSNIVLFVFEWMIVTKNIYIAISDKLSTFFRNACVKYAHSFLPLFSVGFSFTPSEGKTDFKFRSCASLLTKIIFITNIPDTKFWENLSFCPRGIPFHKSTLFITHFYLQIKAAFGGLKETVKFLHLLTANFLNIKIPFPSSNISITHFNQMSISTE